MPLWKLENSLHVGTIIKLHSYLGQVRVAFFMPGFQKYIVKNNFIFIEFEKKPVPFSIESILWSSEIEALVKFYDVDDEHTAISLKNRNLFLDSSKLPKSFVNKITPDISLVGYKVVDLYNNDLGLITEVIDNGPQILLEMDMEGKAVLIPFHHKIVLSTDAKNKKIKVELPEGLLDL